MKSLLVVLLSFVFFTTTGFAQNGRSVADIATLLEHADAFAKYRTFRKDFERMNVDLASRQTNTEDYQKLHAAYDAIQLQYNGLLEHIKADLSNWSAVQDMLHHPDDFAGRYLRDYDAVIQAYERDFTPIYRLLDAQATTAAQGKALPAFLVPLGIELFQGIVDLIKSRREDRDEKRNVILGTINEIFLKKLAMKPWSELGVSAPSDRPGVRSTAAPTTTTPLAAPSQRERTGTQQDPVTPMPVGRPVFSDLSGWVQFFYENDARQRIRMNFLDERASGSKDIGVATWSARNGSVRADSVTTRISVFASEDNYGDGSHFQLKVKNTAGMYVLVLNSGNRVAVLYPPAESKLRDCDRITGPVRLGKDIGVSNFVVGQDENGVTTLPPPMCPRGGQPGEEQYFRISGDARRESFCMLLSRTELDADAIARRLEAETGSLDERLARVFADQLITPEAGRVSLGSGNRVSFDAADLERNVLPLVFYIERR